MTLTIRAEPVPLHVDEHGTVRVAGTRLTLDTLRHQAEVDSYLDARARAATSIRRDLEARQGLSPLRQRRNAERTRADN